MNIYIYTKTGHNVGLDGLRRAAVLYKQLEQVNCDPILCTSDYRAATFARDLDVTKGIGIDIIGNLPNMMERSDMLIFESDEPSQTMRDFMSEYCTKLYEVGVDIPKVLVDDKFFEKKEGKTLDKCFFLSDDDYTDSLLKVLCKEESKQDISCLMGHYFFLGNEDKLEPYFKEIIEEEEYDETIMNTKYLLTGSSNAVFESLASGNCPVFYVREDKEDEDLELIKQYNVPIIYGSKISEIVNSFEDIITNYPEVKKLEKVNTSKIINDIAEVIEKYKAIMPSLEANY